MGRKATQDVEEENAAEGRGKEGVVAKKKKSKSKYAEKTEGKKHEQMEKKRGGKKGCK